MIFTKKLKQNVTLCLIIMPMPRWHICTHLSCMYWKNTNICMLNDKTFPHLSDEKQNKLCYALFRQWSLIWYIHVHDCFSKLHLKRIQKCHLGSGIIWNSFMYNCRKYAQIFILSTNTEWGNTYPYQKQFRIKNFKYAAANSEKLICLIRSINEQTILKLEFEQNWDIFQLYIILYGIILFTILIASNLRFSFLSRILQFRINFRLK